MDLWGVIPSLQVGISVFKELAASIFRSKEKTPSSDSVWWDYILHHTHRFEPYCSTPCPLLLPWKWVSGFSKMLLPIHQTVLYHIPVGRNINSHYNGNFRCNLLRMCIVLIITFCDRLTTSVTKGEWVWTSKKQGTVDFSSCFEGELSCMWWQKWQYSSL